jgi:hypothetical protein
MHSESGANVKLRVRVEVAAGDGERIAEIDVSRELLGILGRNASPQTEKLLLDFVDCAVMSGVRALVRGRITRDQEHCREADIARRWASEGMPDGVDEALASLQACNGARPHMS